MIRTEGRFDLGDFELQSGHALPDAFLGYATHGTLNEARDNVIVYPTWYTGRHDGVEPYIGPGRALDPERYFIVVPDMFTNGLSTSPSNCAAPSGAIETRARPICRSFSRAWRGSSRAAHLWISTPRL